MYITIYYSIVLGQKVSMQSLSQCFLLNLLARELWSLTEKRGQVHCGLSLPCRCVLIHKNCHVRRKTHSVTQSFKCHDSPPQYHSLGFADDVDALSFISTVAPWLWLRTISTKIPRIRRASIFLTHRTCINPFYRIIVIVQWNLRKLRVTTTTSNGMPLEENTTLCKSWNQYSI